MKTLTQNWDLMRILRLVVGSMVIYQSVVSSQLLLGILGGMFVLQALLNVGCAAGSCSTAPQRSKTLQSIENTEYEEVK